MIIQSFTCSKLCYLWRMSPLRIRNDYFDGTRYNRAWVLNQGHQFIVSYFFPIFSPLPQFFIDWIQSVHMFFFSFLFFVYLFVCFLHCFLLVPPWNNLLKILIIHLKYFPDSEWLKVSDDQIWKNFVFNGEMTSKMQPSCRLRHR